MNKAIRMRNNEREPEKIRIDRDVMCELLHCIDDAIEALVTIGDIGSSFCGKCKYALPEKKR